MLCKICPHIMTSTPLALGRPRVAKIVNADLIGIADLRARVGPDCLLVLRWVEQAQPLDNPRWRAQEWYARRIQEREAQLVALGPLAVEGYNEIPDERAGDYADFELQRLVMLHNAGLGAALLSSSVGTPDFPVWDYYQEMIAAMRGGDVLSLHEYWTDYADILNPWHVMRHDKTPWLRSVPKVLTEVGRDIVEGQGRAGYRLTTNDEGFLQDLRRLDTFIRDRADIVGATVFSLGDDPRWTNFRVDELWPKVVAEQEHAPAHPPVVVPPIIKPPAADTFKVLYVHHCGIDAPWRGKASVDATVAYWQGLGWSSWPHWIVGEDGSAWPTFPMNQDGIGVSGHNAGARHVEIWGLFTDRVPPQAQWEGAAALCADLLKKAGLGVGALKMHRESEATECPGQAFAQQWSRFVLSVAARLPHVAPPTPLNETPGDLVKLQWWLEETQRANEDGDVGRVQDILEDLCVWLGRWPRE